ncbi:hypothetical protein DRP44_03705 [candidate division TA06 bacterium]|uniref:Nucleotidyl transferase domain-containing protein n=1 Tax=candidate division TA06 bacterium TaxID=2250710 RepID=A0A660S8Y9_UNCT6|nr:MAG: hypothetical protein DRP44_03705 [candidate division TA06 bacterium]
MKKSIILAAGLGKRMKSSLPKVMHKILGKPMLSYVIDASDNAGINESIIVVGNGKEKVIDYFGNRYKYAVQKELLGTGDAVKSAIEYIDDNDTVVILCGDAPCIKSETIKNAINFHIENEASCTVITAEIDNPFGYGRIVKNNKRIIKIVEEKDANIEIKKIREVNSGIYVFAGKDLRESLNHLSNNNAQNEYYLTDTVEYLNKNNMKVIPFLLNDPFEMTGINDRKRLSEVENHFLRTKRIKLMNDGVTMHIPESIYIDYDAIIKSDVEIYPGVSILGKSFIESGAIIYSNSTIINSNIPKDSIIDPNVVINGKEKE